MLGFEEERIRDWLTLPPQYWDTQAYYRRFAEYAKTLIVVNDHAERSVGMMQKFVHRYSKEEEKQERLLTVDKVRYTMKEPGKSSTKKNKTEMAKSLHALNELRNRN